MAVDHATNDFTDADEGTAWNRAEDMRDDTEDSLALSDGDQLLEYSSHPVSLESEISSSSPLSCYCCQARKECRCCFYLLYNNRKYYGKNF